MRLLCLTRSGEGGRGGDIRGVEGEGGCISAGGGVHRGGTSGRGAMIREEGRELIRGRRGGGGE